MLTAQTAAPFPPSSQTENTVSLKRQETEPFGLNWTSYSTAALHEIVTGSIKELTVLTRRGQKELRERLLPALQEVRRRIAKGESVDGQTTMKEYIGSVGLHEGAVRLWEFRMREQELKELRGEIVPTFTPDAAVNGSSLYDPNFLAKEDADRLFAALSNLPWQPNKDKNRLICWMGIPPLPGAYSSGEVSPWTPEAQEIQKRVQEATGFLFDSLLINSYKDGTQGMGFHVDEEDEGLWDFPIASVSLGARREFQTQRYTKTGHKRMPVSEIYTLPLGHGSLVVMPAGSQAQFVHRLKKTTKACGPRINLTFRMMIPARATKAFSLPAEEAPTTAPRQMVEPSIVDLKDGMLVRIPNDGTVYRITGGELEKSPVGKDTFNIVLGVTVQEVEK